MWYQWSCHCFGLSLGKKFVSSSVCKISSLVKRTFWVGSWGLSGTCGCVISTSAVSDATKRSGTTATAGRGIRASAAARPFGKNAGATEIENWQLQVADHPEFLWWEVVTKKEHCHQTTLVQRKSGPTMGLFKNFWNWWLLGHQRTL